MKPESLCILGAAALAVAWMFAPPASQAAKPRNFSVNMDGNAENCSDIRVRTDGELARSEETFTLSRADAPILEIQDSSGRSGMQVRGWDRADYTVKVCKIAAADSRSDAEAALRGIAVSRSAGRFTSVGPSTEDANWQLYFLVQAPRSANLDLGTRNGPIGVARVDGNLKLRATNGPISVKECAGQVDATTQNGPISFSGNGGEVHLIARNGPISLDLTGEVWNGTRLNARTWNGPVSVSLPETFLSGVRIESDGGSPLSCGAPMCRSAWTDAGSRQRILQMNGSQDTIRVSSNNGPISIGSRKVRR